jgi:hypothetical protein
MKSLSISISGTTVSVTSESGAILTTLVEQLTKTLLAFETEQPLSQKETPADEQREEFQKPEAPKKPRGRKPKEEIAPEAEKEPELEETAAAPTTDGITIDKILIVVGEKVHEHRNEIREKLSAMGVSGVGALPESKHAEFYSFLTSLS